MYMLHTSTVNGINLAVLVTSFSYRDQDAASDSDDEETDYPD